ncbi:F-box protein At3g07870-like [Impatiens glandulifera]|uniref:F-box protein At3g07870-like n=1 Tax=Impatiens glandulifera TaxID=253017 RepID=UPI001FB0FC40|nr:F-box protein At3g07870-like [Impatiens glandulifera]
MNRYVRKKLAAKMEKELAVGCSSTTSIGQVPNNILVDILSRLPIKSVIQCRCVCKSFLSAISQDPEFPPLHLSRSPPELILCPITEHLFLVDYDNNNNDRYHQLNLIQFDGSCPLVPVNSTRGLLCFDLPFSSKSLFVFNPLTHEYIIIPPPMDLIDVKKSYTVHFGFGYSPMTDKYKAIAMVQYRESDNSTTTIAAVYTAGSPSTSSWGIIEEYPPEVVFDRSFPIYLNGYLHWIVKMNSVDCVLSFDFDTEDFGLIAMPPGPFRNIVQQNQHETLVANLFVFEGQLSICMLINRKRVEVWVVKEYGISTSWSKEMVLETPNYSWSYGAFPLKYVDNDKQEVILAFMGDKNSKVEMDFMGDQTLVTYNLVKKKIVKLNELPFHNGILKPLMHVPILLPLKDLIKGAQVHLITDARIWTDSKFLAQFTGVADISLAKRCSF